MSGSSDKRDTMTDDMSPQNRENELKKNDPVRAMLVALVTIRLKP